MATYYQTLKVATKWLSIFLLAFSLINLVAGSAIFGIGIFVFVDLNPKHGGNLIMAFADIHGSASRPGLFKAATFMVVSGVMIIIYSAAIIFSLCKQSYRFMCLYVMLLILCIIFEATTGFYVVRFQQEIDVVLPSFLRWTIKEKYMGLESSEDHFSIVWDYVQKEFTCCGVNNGTDWSAAENWDRNVTMLDTDGYYVNTTLTVPISCCRLLTKSQLHIKWFGQLLTKEAKTIMKEPKIIYEQPCIYEPTLYNSYIGKGCLPSVAKHLLQYNATILSTAVVIILVQIAGILLTVLRYKLAKELMIESNKNMDTELKIFKHQSKTSTKLTPRQSKKRYTYFDDEFDDHWDKPL